MYEDVAEESGYATKTLKEYKSISDAVEPSIRMDDLGWSHHQLVAPLAPAKQEEYLQKAVESSRRREDLESARRRAEFKSGLRNPDLETYL